MRKNILMLLAPLVMVVYVVFSFTTSLAQTPTEVEQQAFRIYNNLSTLSMNDRKRFYTELTPALKSELWKVQLRSFLSKNPYLTDRQRQAIGALIAFSKPQVYEIPQDSPGWEERVNKPVQNLTKRILEVFPREVARGLLTVLGGSEPLISLNLRRINFVSSLINSGCTSTGQETNLPLVKKKINIQQQPFKIISANFTSQPEPCDCSTRSDWCMVDNVCEPLPCEVRQWCGTLGLYICNGLCIYYDDCCAAGTCC